MLSPERYQIIICGTSKEKELTQDKLRTLPAYIVAAMGKMTIDENIELIASAKALIAASIGPLHIAASCGIKFIGIYLPIKPMHPARWQPLGKKAAYLSSIKNNCDACRNNLHICTYMNDVIAQQVFQLIES